MPSEVEKTSRAVRLRIRVLWVDMDKALQMDSRVPEEASPAVLRVRGAGLEDSGVERRVMMHQPIRSDRLVNEELGKGNVREDI